MADIFLSYSRVDRAKAQVIAKSLEAEGFSVWWDKVLRAGQTYDEVTEGMLRNSKAVVVLWSKTSVKSKWVRAEATLGERTSALIPASIEEADRPIMFELVQTADLIGWEGDRDEERWKIFIEDLKLAMGHDLSEDDGPDTESESEEQAAPPPPPPPEETLEEQFWNAITDDSNIDELKEYVERYPDGRHADEARERISQMESQAEAERQARQQAADEARERQAREEEQRRQQAAAQNRAAATADQPAKATKPTDKPDEEDKSSSNTMVLVGIAAAVLIVGGAGAAFFMLGGSDDPDRVTDVAEASTTMSSEADGEDNTPDVTDVANTQANEAADTTAELPDSETSDTSEADAEIIDAGETPVEGLDSSDAAESNSVEDGPAATASGEEDTSDEVASEVAEDSVSEGSEETAAISLEFSDCDLCPDMKRFDDARFTMGSPETEVGHVAYEGPLRDVALAPFAIGIAEVTYDEWDACVAAGGCNGYTPVDRGYGRGDQPVMSISWNDAQAYVQWLSQETGRGYRLPSEAEWEFAARGGTRTAYWWGDAFNRSHVPTDQPHSAGDLPANGLGIKGTLGNLQEWVQDCYVNNYDDAPLDGRAVTAGDCSRRVMRGGSWRSSPNEMRAANRSRISRNTRDRSYGFRVATSDLP